MADRHLGEDDFTLLHYGELPAAEVRAARAHLEGCGDCRARQAEMERLFAMVGDGDVPEPDAAFESQVWRRLQPALRAEREGGRRAAGAGWAARLRDWFSLPAPGRWALAGGVATLVLAAFVAGRLWPGATSEPARPAAAELAAGDIRERVLLSALGDHFDRTEAMLVELAGTAPGGRVSIAAEQRRAGDLLAATRLYRRAAVEAGDTGVADVLESLQRILVEVTGSPSELSAFELQALQTRIEKQELLFKLRIASSAVRNRESRAHRTGPGPVTGA
jgi:hypothetical protein